jgi:hypothetical protein
MGILVIMILGIFGVVLWSLLAHSKLGEMRKINQLANTLKSKKLFHHYWATGILSFFMNALLIFFTMLVLYGIQLLFIPFIHVIVMVLAVGLSLFFWQLINLTWQGKARDRLKVGMIGSSFYFFLTLFFIYKNVTIESMYPGDDPFMRAIGFMLGMMVTSIAFLTCFFITGFARRKVIR